MRVRMCSRSAPCSTRWSPAGGPLTVRRRWQRWRRFSKESRDLYRAELGGADRSREGDQRVVCEGCGPALAIDGRSEGRAGGIARRCPQFTLEKRATFAGCPRRPPVRAPGARGGHSGDWHCRGRLVVARARASGTFTARTGATDVGRGLDRITRRSRLMDAWLRMPSDRSGEGNLDIWIQQIPNGVPVRVTRHAADDVDPSFYADGGSPFNPVAPRRAFTSFLHWAETNVCSWNVDSLRGSHPTGIARVWRLGISREPDLHRAGIWDRPPRSLRASISFAHPCGHPMATRCCSGDSETATLRRENNVDWYVSDLKGGPPIRTGGARCVGGRAPRRSMGCLR